jgi:hypothetical protein
LSSNSNSQHFERGSPSAHDPNFIHDGYSTATGAKQRHRSIMDILHERITQYVSNENASEFSQLKIENDMVNTFFDEIHRMSEQFTFNFIETLK